MSADDFQRLKAEFHALLDLAPAQRAQHLARLAEREPGVASELERLLETFDADDLRADTARSDPLIGCHAGPFALTRRLGAGGMGVVYLGERDDGAVSQRVAIKLPGRLALLAIADGRIGRERELLARLSHPHVARLVDAGRSEALGPWFAMEYVEGDTLTRHADHARLDVHARIRLWLQVADAVAYAHSNAIVHRDLKPANVLVDANGNAKLLDFGIAKFLDPASAATSTSAAFTARYAAPEQVSGDLATTATDVHGLGVLLYELLCGQPPYTAVDDLALRQSIVTADPPSLRSTLAESSRDQGAQRANARSASSEQLRRQFDRDIEAIVAKSLRKLPAERYASVAEFAADARRYLAGDAVLARRPTLRYRLARFARRHRAISGGAMLAVVGLLVGLAIAVQQRAEALRSADRAEQQNALLVGLLSAADPYNLRGSSLTVSELLSTAATRTAAQQGLDPVLRASLLDAIGHALFTLGRSAEADVALSHAADSLAGSERTATELSTRIAVRRVASGFERDRQQQALAALDALWPQVEQGSRELRIEAQQVRAHVRQRQNDHAGALADIDAALALCGKRCGGDSDARLSLRLKRMDILVEAGQHDAAMREADQVWAEVSALPDGFDGIRVWVGRQRANVLTVVGRGADAEQLLVDLVPRAERAYGANSSRMGTMHASIEFAQRRRGRLRAAADSAARSAAVYAVALPGSIYEAYALKAWGDNLRGLGDTDAAIERFERCSALFRTIGDVSSLDHASWCELEIAFARFERAPDAKAATTLRSLADAYLARGAGSYRGSVQAMLAEVAVATGDVACLQQSIDVLAATTSASASRSSQLGLAMYRWQLARLTGVGIADAIAGIDALTATPGDDALQRANVASLRAIDALPSEAAARCQAAREAWHAVDPQETAWRNQLRKLPRCSTPP